MHWQACVCITAWMLGLVSAYGQDTPPAVAASAPAESPTASGTPAPAATQSAEVKAAAPATRQVHLASSEKWLWVVVGDRSAGAETFTQRFAFLDDQATRLRAISNLRPQQGTVALTALVGSRLHLFFDADRKFKTSGAHFSYSAQGSTSGALYRDGTRELPLPGPTLPLAVAGESPSEGRPQLWAVVSAETAGQVARAWQDRQASQLAGNGPPTTASAPTTTRPATTRPAGLPPPSYELVQYDGVGWQPGYAITSYCSQAARLWLAVAPDRFYVFWQRHPAEKAVNYAWLPREPAGPPDTAWVVGPSIRLERELASGLADVINRKLVFAALLHGEADELTPASWYWQKETSGGGAWHAVAPLLVSDKDGADALGLPVGSALGGYKNFLVLARPTGEGADLAYYPASTGGAPQEPFAAVPISMEPLESPTRRNLRELAATLIVVALMLLVFWRRQESLANPIPLPVGWLVAGAGKRALIAFVDMLPAIVIVALIWRQPLGEFLRDLQAASTHRDPDVIAGLQQRMADGLSSWAMVWFRLLYVGYCLAWELPGLATPGKRLLGCQVRGETLEPPNPVQIITRNLSKLLELEPMLQIWPFMLVVVLTRNRQRVGDLLARTIVVERVAVPGEDQQGSEK